MEIGTRKAFMTDDGIRGHAFITGHASVARHLGEKQHESNGILTVSIAIHYHCRVLTSRISILEGNQWTFPGRREVTW